MMEFQQEPLIRVGLLSGVKSVRFALTGQFKNVDGAIFERGEYIATLNEDGIKLAGTTNFATSTLSFEPVDFASCQFKVYDVVIGINFHWQRKEDQTFQGSLQIKREDSRLLVINQLPVESYLVSVISSEMSASCPPELLRAHAIVSRSWLLAQLVNAKKIAALQSGAQEIQEIHPCQNNNSCR